MSTEAVWVQAWPCLSLAHHCFDSTVLQGSLTSCKSLPGEKSPPSVFKISLFQAQDSLLGNSSFLGLLCMNTQYLLVVQQMELLSPSCSDLVKKLTRTLKVSTHNGCVYHIHMRPFAQLICPFNASLRGCWHSLYLMNDRTGQNQAVKSPSALKWLHKITQRTNTLKRMDTSETHICLQEENLLGLGELHKGWKKQREPQNTLCGPFTAQISQPPEHKWMVTKRPQKKTVYQAWTQSQTIAPDLCLPSRL